MVMLPTLLAGTDFILHGAGSYITPFCFNSVKPSALSANRRIATPGVLMSKAALLLPTATPNTLLVSSSKLTCFFCVCFTST